MNKREVLLSLTDPSVNTPYIPAGFFLHFDKSCHRGQPAVDKHLEFFQYTGMDFLKIQYETSFPKQPEIINPKDWSKVPLRGAEFYQDQWDLTKGLVSTVGKDALVLMALYSPFMCAGQVVGREVLSNHIQENPEKVKEGVEIITESLMIFTKGCIDRGVDGFYHSTQGGETYRFGGSPLFDLCVKPYDLALMSEINNNSTFNILHICDYHGGYSDYSPFYDYPGDIVNCSLKLGTKPLSGDDISKIFGRPFMGGMDRHGAIVSGSKEEIEKSVESIIRSIPSDFILGADCTVPGDINWENLKTAISYAHHSIRQ